MVQAVKHSVTWLIVSIVMFVLQGLAQDSFDPRLWGESNREDFMILWGMVTLFFALDWYVND